MPVTSPNTIVAAIQADLAANVALNPAKTWSYAEPTVIPPDVCPMLAVWCETTDYELLTGANSLQAYERKHQVTVAWYVYSTLMGDTGGTGDPATVSALDMTAETLIARLATYAAGVPTIGPQLVATLASRELVPKAGSIWSAQIKLVVEEAS